MSKLKETLDIEKSLTRQRKKLATSSSVKNVCDDWLQSLQRIESVCKERNRY